MNKDKETKYIRRYLQNFIERFHPSQMKTDVVNTLVSFVKYERLNNYCHQVILSNENSSTFKDVVDEFVKANPEGNVEDFSLGLKAAASILEHKLAHLNYRLEVELNSLSTQKRKNKRALNDFKEKLSKLEWELKQSKADLVQKMALAYKAGQNSCEVVSKNTLTGTPVFFIKRCMNFKKWANQIWKYGKTKKQPLEDYPYEEDNNEEEMPPIIEQVPRGILNRGALNNNIVWQRNE